MKRLTLFPVLLVCAAGLVCSIDFGLLLSQEIETAVNPVIAPTEMFFEMFDDAEEEKSDENDYFSYTPAFSPWFSWDGGENISVYVSNIFFFEYYNYPDYRAGSGWTKPEFKFELTYTAVNYRINESMSLEAGRIEYADPMVFAATGLFDGARFTMELPMGTINAGAYYTGFLYKETAQILMTFTDMMKYAEPWNKNLGKYFASRRFLTAVRWDMPLKEIINLSAEFLLQFDVNGEDEYLHSQYGEVKAEFSPFSGMGITAGALFEIMEGEDGNSCGAFGLLASMKMDVPGPLNDWLNASFKLTSGPFNDNSIAFTPISCVSQGDVFPGTISGLAYPSATYSVRLLDTLFVQGSLRYFISTYDHSDTDGDNLYGAEMWASAAWQPLEDIRLTVGTGVFFPGLGNVYPKGTDTMWKLNAVLALSL